MFDEHCERIRPHFPEEHVPEVRLVPLCFEFYMIEAKPENLVGDRAYIPVNFMTKLSITGRSFF
jgi:hypothetical protein